MAGPGARPGRPSHIRHRPSAPPDGGETRPNILAIGQDAWLTVLMLKSGTRRVGIAVRLK